jgi:4-hydroxy-2,2'-bipyrrole-5-carbaldehyde O-methyltransferase
MSARGMVKFLWENKPLLLVRMSRNLDEMYRAAFVSTLVSEGIGEHLRSGPKSLEALHTELELHDSHQQLEAWLDVGVSLGVLGKTGADYRLKGPLAVSLSDPANRVWHAFFQTRVEVFFDYVRQTPAKLRRQERFNPNKEHGALVAQSSRTVEPLLVEVVDRVVPEGKRSMLEVGCGSGVYVKRACDRNPDLQVFGLELTDEVTQLARNNVQRWGLEDRVTIETGDVRAFQQPGEFDLVTLYNLIYYFPSSERVALLRHLGRLIAPDGRLVLATLTKGGDSSTRTMDLWSSMTEGCGPLPTVTHLQKQLREAGFSNVQHETLIPNYVVFTAY